MYQSLLNDIISSYNNKILYDQINKGLFNYTNDDEDDEGRLQIFSDKVLVIGNNINGANVFQIRLESSLVSKQLNNWYDILLTNDIRTFIDTSIKCGINKNSILECNNCCRAYVNRISINNSIILCEDCITNIKSCGVFNVKFGLNFVNNKEYQAIGQTKCSYTINTDSLNIFCQQETIFCRFIITVSSEISNFTLQSHRTNRYNHCQMCLLSYDKQVVNFICDQCYNILNYRNEILKEFNFCKFLLFKNLQIIDNDVILFISSLLMKITL